MTAGTAHCWEAGRMTPAHLVKEGETTLITDLRGPEMIVRRYAGSRSTVEEIAFGRTDRPRRPAGRELDASSITHNYFMSTSISRRSLLFQSERVYFVFITPAWHTYSSEGPEGKLKSRGNTGIPAYHQKSPPKSPPSSPPSNPSSAEPRRRPYCFWFWSVRFNRNIMTLTPASPPRIGI